jgi:hypothetical protein
MRFISYSLNFFGASKGFVLRPLLVSGVIFVSGPLSTFAD